MHKATLHVSFRVQGTNFYYEDWGLGMRLLYCIHYRQYNMGSKIGMETVQLTQWRKLMWENLLPRNGHKNTSIIL